MKLVTVDEMRAIEKEADALGWSYANMMDQAGLSLALTVQAYFSNGDKLFAVGLVGSGNNGGDTLIALAELAGMGWQTGAYLLRSRPDEDDLIKRLRASGGAVVDHANDLDFTVLDAWLNEGCVLLDGVLGTGTRLPLRSEIAAVLAHVKSHGLLPPVVAVDCPSGVDCDSGQAAEECIPAVMTVCMAAVKAGLLKFPAFGLVGELREAPIGLPAGLDSWEKIRCEVIDAEFVRAALPIRAADGHKGTFGTAVIAAGSLNFPGAALLAGKAALWAGTGLVTLAVPAPIQSALVGHIPEATWLLLGHQMGSLSGDGASTLASWLGKADALLLGPGFGQEDCTADFLRKVLTGAQTPSGKGVMGFVGAGGSGPGNRQPAGQKALPPCVVDADGLKLLTRIADWASILPAQTVLTPHPGEMAVLCGLETKEVQLDRKAIAERYARDWGHVVVLKGAFTLIASPDGRVGVIPVATSALAHAGSGDVLAGLITGLRAQGVAAFEAAAAGAWLHAQAGLAAEDRLGHPAGVTASEILESLRAVIAIFWPR